MTNYKYDIRLGHYVAINNSLFEGEIANTNVEGTQQQTGTNGANSTNGTASTKNAQSQVTATTQTATLVNLETSDIVQMKKDMQTKLEQIQRQIDDKMNNISQIQKQLADLQSAKAEQKKLNSAQKTLLQAQQELADKKFEYAKKSNEEIKKILDAQNKLIESMNFDKNILPEKYRMLTESNIQNAKIYVDKLIKDDSMERIKGMVDFKKAFKESELLYGKDSNGGYFAVCVDQSDFNKLTDTLEEVGYLRDDILAYCLPQIFDRSQLTK